MRIAYCALVLALALPLANAQGDKQFVETAYWKFDLRPIKLNKLRVQADGNRMYFYLLYEVVNTGKESRKPEVIPFIMTDLQRAGVGVDEVKDFNQFREFKLPAVPEDGTQEFDNGGKLAKLKRYYDLRHAPAKAAIEAKEGGTFTHAWDMTPLAGNASAKGVAIFRAVDAEARYLGLFVKGLTNRIVNINNEHFMEDRALLLKYHMPGDVREIDERTPTYMGSQWVVIKREKVKFP